MYSIPQTPDGRIEKDRLHKSSLVSLVFFIIIIPYWEKIV